MIEVFSARGEVPVSANPSNQIYHQTIRELSDRIVEAQQPIRVLDAIKWDAGVRDAFFAGGCKQQPVVDRDYYAARPLGFDAAEKRQQFYAIERDIVRRLGQFTKDLVYNKGFIMVYNYIQLAVRKGMLSRIPLLFCGKVVLDDMRTLAQLVEEGIVKTPVFLLPQFADLNALAAWMCYSNFLNRLSLARVEADYANIF